MKNLLLKLSARERLLLYGGGIILLVLSLYAFTYAPLIDGQKRLKSAIAAQQDLQTHLQHIRSEAMRLSATTSTAPNAASPTNQSLIGLIDSSSEQVGIKSNIKRLTPEGADKVTLWLEKADFDQLVTWLAQLDKNQAVSVEQMSSSREGDKVGLVSGKVLLGKVAAE
jgi:general secretion pathway protein M